MGPEPSGKLPRSAWLKAARLTAIVIACSIVVSAVVSTILLDLISNGIDEVGLIVSIVMPIVIGTPVMFYLAVGRQRLKLANAQLAQLASVDWLTDCLNRRAFTSEVSRHLERRTSENGSTEGALLIIDADHFKTVNDRFGHESGDEALQLMAAAIKASVRADDLVGRLGGEEFGVFLHGVDADTAAVIAERVRGSIEGLVFAPDGHLHPLSVSVGGVMFKGEAGFSDLFRIADQRLYGVKHTGRGRVDLIDAVFAGPSLQMAPA